MTSASRKRSVTIRGHRTSFSLEDRFWQYLQEMAVEQGRSVASLVADVDTGRGEGCSLSSAIRLAVLDWARRRPPSRPD